MRGNGPLMAEGMIRAWLNGSRAGCDARPGVNNAVLRKTGEQFRPPFFLAVVPC